MNLIIDPEFSSLIPPLTDEEFAGLEKSIKEEGCRDALVVWDNDGKKILVDGHNRYRICQKHGIQFRTVEKEFESRSKVKAWMAITQLGRRNLSAYDRTTLALVYEQSIAEEAHKNKQKATGGDRRSNDFKKQQILHQDKFQVPQKSADVENHTEIVEVKVRPSSVEEVRQHRKEVASRETREQIAKIAGVSRDTVQKVKVINEKADDRTKELVRSGQMSINQAFNSVHPKRTDPVETAKKEHLEYEMRKAEKKVDIQAAQRDKTNQKVINSALMQDVLKLLSSIEKFSLEHDGLDMNILSQMVGSDFDRRALIDRCNRCRKVIFKIEEGIRE